jgi:peptidoglycan hydrolase-like protein with peptidoglycan-binding domain
MKTKKAALTAAVIFGGAIGLAASPALSQSAPGGKSVPPDLDRTPSTQGRDQQSAPRATEIPKGSEGMTADEIKQVQQALQTKGHSAGTSGVMDEKTRDAIRAFQKANGLTTTGMVDDKTAQALGVSTKSSSGSGGRGSKDSSGTTGSSGSSGSGSGGARSKSAD